MHHVIVSVGRWKRGPERDLFERYVERCTWRIDLVELNVTKNVPTGELRRFETDLIRARLDRRRPTVLLDERGEMASSDELATMLEACRRDGAVGANFVIGGADGVDPSFRAEASRMLAFGRLTWPHLFARVLLAEQLYRASTILAGHPYHRGNG